MSDLYIKKRKPVFIKKFTPDMADLTKADEDSQFSIHYIRTHEGLRMIDTTMYVAIKSPKYRHPMAPEVFNDKYVPFESDEHGEECHW